MGGDAVDEAVDRLAARYPTLGRAVVDRVLEEAYATVEASTGRLDLILAEDLAELRLQIRGRAGLL